MPDHLPRDFIDHRISSTREKMAELELDGLIVLNAENKGYLTGFTTGVNIAPGGTLLITRCTEADHFITGTVDYEECRKKLQPLGFEVLCYDYRQGQDAVSVTAGLVEKLQMHKVGIPETSISAGELREYTGQLHETKIEPVEDPIAQLRCVKDSWEIQQIRSANRVSKEAFEYALKRVEPGMTEWQLAAELEYQLRLRGRGSPRLAFSSVVVSGARTSMPHGSVTQRKIQPGDLVTVDFGATYNGYCADITRTFVLGSASDRQREVYSAVLQAQLAAIEAVAPQQKRTKAAEQGMNVLREEGLAEYAVHGAGGHGIGLQVHEGPTTSGCGKWETGNIVTIEPGVYIPEWGGVRIEDDILVTDTGREILADINKELLQLHP